MENGPIKLSKVIIHRITGYPTLGQIKTMSCDPIENIEKDIGVVWNKRGLNIYTILYHFVAFLVRVIAHKFGQSSRSNNVPCIAVNLGYKLVRKDNTYDLVEL